ncbi:MAG: carbonic anhydrase [Myxococcota bacterium]
MPDSSWDGKRRIGFHMRRLAFALLFVSTLAGCNRGAQATAEARPARPKPAAKPAEKAAKPKPVAETSEHSEGPRKFVVPFAWEASRDEPLAQARSYLKEILNDNRVYMEHGPKFFASFADGQKPRATVVSCADSRVHTPAFDTTPENDDFMVRNIGNQIENGLGSIEYGVAHLETPVLMILGHTGCGAVKAAMGDISSQSEPVRRELEKLHVSKPKAGDPKSDAAWSEAVVENVRAQVAHALTHFGARVSEGKLTVVGAVYDFRNDLGKGSGKITIVDVNGNAEPARMEAFVEAIESEGALRKKDKDARGKKRETGLPAGAEIISPELQRAIERANEISGGKAAPPAQKPTAATAPAAPPHAH